MIDRWMKVAVIALPLFAPSAFAGDEDAELELKLDAARERLEQASREVAELSAQLGAQAVDYARHLQLDGRRAMLGINMDEPKGGDRDRGVLISGVTPGGPADEAGLRSGDVVVSLNGTSLVKDAEGSPQKKVLQIMREIDPGDEVSIEYERDGTRETTTALAEEMNPASFAFAFDEEAMEALENLGDLDDLHMLHDLPMLHDFNARWGNMEMVSLTTGLGEYFGTAEGILVVRAPEDADIDLQDGDVILRIDGRTPTSPSHALRILRSYQGGEHLNIEIVRKQRPMTIEVALPERSKELRESRLPFNIPLPPPVRVRLREEPITA